MAEPPGAASTAVTVAIVSLALRFMADPFLIGADDPLYLAAANRVAKRVEGITDQTEDLPTPDLFEYADRDVGHHLSHLSLLRCCDRRHPCDVRKLIPPRNRRVMDEETDLAVAAAAVRGALGGLRFLHGVRGLADHVDHDVRMGEHRDMAARDLNGRRAHPLRNEA